MISNDGQRMMANIDMQIGDRRKYTFDVKDVRGNTRNGFDSQIDFVHSMQFSDWLKLTFE